MGVIAQRAMIGIRTGALNQEVRVEPLPVGVYWIDVYDDSTNNSNIATFRDWLTLHIDTVDLLREEEYNASAGWNIFETDPHRFWFLFSVKSPTRWDNGPSLGYPSEGEKGMVSGDTIQKPDPPATIFDDEFEFPTWIKWSLIAGGVIIVGGIAYSIIK